MNTSNQPNRGPETPQANLNSNDPYAILGLTRDASLREVKRAYFALVREYPPEQDPAAFKKLRAAYEKLRTADVKAETDLFLFQAPVPWEPRKRRPRLDLEVNMADIQAHLHNFGELAQTDFKDDYQAAPSMSDRRQVWATLAELLQRVERGLVDQEKDNPTDLQRELRKLGKEQFKANTLAERQSDHWGETVDSLQKSVAQNEQLLAERSTAVNQQLLLAILPALDGLEQALTSGRQYLDQQGENRPLQDEKDRQMLASWLHGLTLIHERLLAVLAVAEVNPIPTVGHPFDPFLHQAVGTSATGHDTPGYIVSEERPGYQSQDGVLRYAEVIVYKPNS